MFGLTIMDWLKSFKKIPNTCEKFLPEIKTNANNIKESLPNLNNIKEASNYVVNQVNPISNSLKTNANNVKNFMSNNIKESLPNMNNIKEASNYVVNQVNPITNSLKTTTKFIRISSFMAGAGLLLFGIGFVLNPIAKILEQNNNKKDKSN